MQNRTAGLRWNRPFSWVFCAESSDNYRFLNIKGMKPHRIRTLHEKCEEDRPQTQNQGSRSNMIKSEHPFLCRRIGSKRNLLIVGDSINHEIQWVVLNNLGVNMSGKTPSQAAVRSWQGEEVCADVLGGVGFKVSRFLQ